MNSSIRATSGRFLRVVVMLSIERNYARGILRGVEEYCVAQSSTVAEKSAAKWHLAVYPLMDILWSRRARRKIREWRPDAILAEINSPSLACFCAGFKKPVVQLMHPTASSGFPRVGLDDLAVGRRAADYFLQKGYRSFGYCGLTRLSHFDRPWLRWNELRQEGYVEAINDFFKRLPGRTAVIPDINIFSDDTPATQRRSRNKTGRNTERQIAQWLTTLPPHTAIFCGCDDWAVNVLRAAQSIQLHVPVNIAVLGADDDILFCQLVDPPLSSIVTGDERVGREAAKLLGAMLAGGATPAEPILLAPLGVTERQSSNITAISDADVSAALDYIKKHALDNLSVKTLMAHLPVNRRTLEMKFQRILGRSPADEVHRVRLEHLKMLLRTDLSIGQIVRRMNYSSSQYLARTFRRDTGMSLTQYRRTIA